MVGQPDIEDEEYDNWNEIENEYTSSDTSSEGSDESVSF